MDGRHYEDMMTSMGPSFAGHPAGMHQHPGVPGHAMASGMPHNPSQPGAPAGAGMPQQMHMAVSGPGGQVNPATLMGGIPPGAAGPNAHALQHLNPAQNPMFQQGQFANCKCSSPPSLSLSSPASFCVPRGSIPFLPLYYVVIIAKC